MSAEIADFVAFLAKERNDSPHTVKAYARDVRDFAAFCGRYYGGAWGWAGVDRLAIRGWLGALQQRGLAKRSAARALSALRTFYRFLNATRGVEVNPAKAARTPKAERHLPVHLDRAEVDLLFAEAERRATAGGFTEVRDLAMLELFYSTGIRLAELAGLNDPDVDLVADQVKVRGKGKKERIVPLGSHAGRALRRYFRQRDALSPMGTRDRRAVFVGRRGAGSRRAVCSSRSSGCSARWPGGASCTSTRCGIRSPPTCSTPEPTCGRCRSSWATPRSARRRCILIRRWNG